MPSSRRKFIKQTSVLAVYAVGSSALLIDQTAEAAADIAKSATSLLEQTLKDLFRDASILATDQIDIQIPLIAENGAVVPITITSTLNNVRNIYILVEKNPLPLSAKFALAPELEPFVSARLKMAETSDVIVVVETDQALYSARSLVKVTIGGCGG
jgi:sulfur-oxidizing protein SoxY